MLFFRFFQVQNKGLIFFSNFVRSFTTFKPSPQRWRHFQPVRLLHLDFHRKFFLRGNCSLVSFEISCYPLCLCPNMAKTNFSRNLISQYPDMKLVTHSFREPRLLPNLILLISRWTHKWNLILETDRWQPRQRRKNMLYYRQKLFPKIIFR